RRDLPLVTRSSTPAAFTRGPGASLRDRLDGRTADALERAQARGSAGLIANTAEHGEVIARAYRLSGRQPSAVIGLSLPPEICSSARAAAYPETDAPLRLLFVGRAEARKGFDALLDAVAILAAEQEAGALPPFRLDLVGVPPNDLPPDLPDAARQRISARGRIDAAALAQAYADAHAVLAPSRYESFGLVYQEAMAYGRPVVACAEDASARAFVGASGAGPLAQTATGPALADALRPLLLDPGLRRAYRMRALAAAGRFDRASLGRETLALYEAAIAAARHP
ncbi:MAG: glycosyltransferase family 4 protein, partial [Methylorubrum extorquens]